MLRHTQHIYHRITQPLRQGDRGASAVEYGLLVALIAAVVVTAVTLLGTNLASIFNTVANAI